MNNKVGRPEVPQNEAKSVLRGAMYAPKDLKELDQARASRGLDNSKFIREAVDMEVQRPPIWVKSQWKPDELDGQFIEFTLKSKVPMGIRVLEGIGKMKVRENSRGEIAVDIFIDQFENPNKGVTTRIWLSQEAVDKIKLNPNPKPAKFKLLG